MVRGLILEQWLANISHLLSPRPESPGSYPVLAPLSRCYSKLQGRLPTRYSPVRHFTLPIARNFSSDLHVLSTPLAFVLSQDQTLQLNRHPKFLKLRYFILKSGPNE